MYSVIWRLINLKKSLADDKQHEVKNQFADSIGLVKSLTDKQLLVTYTRDTENYSSFGSLSILGALIFGIVAMFGLLNSTPNQPVNLFYILIIFGPIQWILMTLAVVSYAKNLIPILNFSDKSYRQLLPDRLAGTLLFQFNQSLSLLFLLSSLFTFMVLLVIQDLSFGWQTTLHSDFKNINNLLFNLAQPWIYIWPEAVPTDSMIEATRFYQLATHDMTVDNAQIFGLWWRFIVAYIVTYAVLPRLLLWLYAKNRLVIKINTWIKTDPHFQKFIRQIRQPELSIKINSGKNDPESLVPRKVSHITGMNKIDRNADISLLWKIESSQHVFQEISSELCLGFPGQWQADQVLLLSLLSKKIWNIFVPGWEPPTAEFSDLIAPYQVSNHIRIIPVPLKGKLSESHWLSWQQFQQNRLPGTELVPFE